jgi:hypothetical protein
VPHDRHLHRRESLVASAQASNSSIPCQSIDIEALESQRGSSTKRESENSDGANKDRPDSKQHDAAKPQALQLNGRHAQTGQWGGAGNAKLDISKTALWSAFKKDKWFPAVPCTRQVFICCRSFVEGLHLFIPSHRRVGLWAEGVSAESTSIGCKCPIHPAMADSPKPSKQPQHTTPSQFSDFHGTNVAQLRWYASIARQQPMGCR